MSFYRLLRHHWLAIGWLGFVLLAALSAPTAHPEPDLQHTNAAPLHPLHWLGTTPQGLDVAMSLWLGARTLLVISLPAAALTLLLGACLGGAAGFWGDTQLRVARWPLLACGLATCSSLGLWPYNPGLAIGSLGLAGLLLAVGVRLSARSYTTSWRLPVDSLVLGVISLLNAVPLLVLVVAVAAIQRPSLLGTVILLSATCWTTPARLMRTATRQSAQQPYAEAARASGIPPFRVLWRHISPNAVPVLLVRFPLTVAILISLEATLSFLGVGLPPDTPSWGRLLAAVRQAPTDWWLLVCPGLAITCTVLSLHRLTSLKKD